MRKFFALLLTVIIVAVTGCGSTKNAGTWTDEDFSFQNQSEVMELPSGSAMMVREGKTYTLPLKVDAAGYEEYPESFTMDRGLELGSTLKDYKKLYPAGAESLIWEVYTSDGDTYFKPYGNETLTGLYDAYEGSVWLDVAYAYENGTWVPLAGHELQDIWFCEADPSEYDRVALLSVNFDKEEIVTGIYLYHIVYDEAFIAWQNWAE